MKELMNDTLERLGIDAECVRAEAHRHLAFFDVKLGNKTPVRKLEGSAREIALHLKSKTVPLMKLIPMEGIVRVQVALKDAELITLRSLLSGEVLSGNAVFPMLLGEDESGSKLWTDMNENPHLLIAGATGSGKSTLVHTLISNALNAHAGRFRFMNVYLGDPKRVEFNQYKDESISEKNGGPIKRVSSSYEEVVDMLDEIYQKMELRYKVMHEAGMRSVEENPQYFPIIFCIIDEVADLMMQDKKSGQLQDLIVKIAQKGRASGIFLALATQRPSVDVLTGIIKANFPGRIACKTASRKDSEVILDRTGAETLLGRGDAVLQNMKRDSVRFQVSYITPEDAIDIYHVIRKKNEAA